MRLPVVCVGGASLRYGEMLRPHVSPVGCSLYRTAYRTLSTSTLRPASDADHLNKSAIGSKVWQDYAETVIIGGGVIGASIAYHLAKAGQKDVVLLEKTELTAGSTWQAVGITSHFHPGVNIKKIHFDSLDLYKRLEEETGQDVGLHVTGSIRLGCCEERVKELKYQLSRQGWHQAPMRLVGPDEIQEMVPILNMDEVLMGLYTPDDGHIDPYSVTQAMAIGARQYGATIHQHTPVTAMRQAGDGGWELDTPRGGVKATRVVNAAGFWARELGKMVGIDLPLVPVDLQYLVTKAIPEVEELKKEIPVLRDLEGSVYLRQEGSGVIFGAYEDVDKMRLVEDWYIDGPPPTSGCEMFAPDLDRFQSHIERAMFMFPVLEKAEIKRVVAGPIVYTPDVLPMVGPYQGLRNYWTAVGFSYGITHAGGVGKYLASWILNGEPSYDLTECDPNRYSTWTNRDYTFAKCRESYGFNNIILFPNEERFAGRPTMRVNGIYEELVKRGAQMGFHAGWEQPAWFALPGDETGYKPSFHRTNWFEPVRRECDLVMTKAGIIDLTPCGKLEVSGPDAHKFMDYICANHVPEVGHSQVSHMLTPSGRVYAELTVTQTEPNTFLCTTGTSSDLHDLRWMEEHATGGNFDVVCQAVTDELATLGLAGPRSRDIMAKLVTNDVSDAAFPHLTVQRGCITGVPVQLVRASASGELGWELYMNIDDVQTVYNAVLEAGEEFGVGDFGTYAMNTLRLEKGFRAWGAEMKVDYNGLEAGLEDFIQMDKSSDFIGKDCLKKLKAEGLRRHLVVMTVDTTDVDPHGNESIWYNDEVVGMTTSGGYGYTVNQSVAFGYVPTELSTAGSRVYVELLGEKRPATVCKNPTLLSEAGRGDLRKVIN